MQYQHYERPPSSAKYDREVELKPLTRRDKLVITVCLVGAIAFAGLIFFGL